MISDQSCPLCGEKLDIVQNNYPQSYTCTNEECYWYQEYLVNSQIKGMNLQIARIKEAAFKEGCLKAKQEVFEDVCNFINELIEIKKKHGVE